MLSCGVGATGGYTVRQLLAKKHAVRLLAHRADDRSKQLRELGAEVVLIRAALQGVQCAYFCSVFLGTTSPLRGFEFHISVFQDC
jgi:uncharacterized protein YbjT (DUF2867 family)